MNLVVVSQCAKNALTETRRIMDQFAERSGHRTWIFESSDQGQEQIRKMLKRSARKNTAVICYHIKKAGGKDILWLVGNPRRFNETGAVPTNSTRRDILGSHFENSWKNLQVIKLFAGIAGLFHDVGKANALFQAKLKSAKRSAEPVRHEWLSLLIFEAFVNSQQDQDWLQRLATITPVEESNVMARLITERVAEKNVCRVIAGYNPFKRGLLTPIAKIVGWLIVSHHRLPEIPEGEDILDNIDMWLEMADQLAPGNSPQIHNNDWTAKDWQKVLDFKTGTPLKSKTWCAKANKLAVRLLKLDAQKTIYQKTDWMADPFVMHLSRLSLMLSDHLYSSQLPNLAWQDKKVRSYANTHMQDDKSHLNTSDDDTSNGIISSELLPQYQKGDLKQKLDEHNIGVANHSFIFPNLLPNLRRDLPSFSYCKPLKKFASHKHFAWQNKAYQLACGLKERSQSQGFIGFNLASTGRGKTLGNAKIMYALADEKQGCRFSVALGLRTLTLQTGDAFKDKLQLNDEDIAVMIGSQAVLQLHKNNQSKEPDDVNEQLAGSESLTPLFRSHETVHYQGTAADTRLNQWLSKSEKAQKMLDAPILVSTIDHLIPATDGCRGGKQIAPMLRLLTADLVLDEPDDFGLEDLPALCRLVNWAGMLGARVLLSSATIPPGLAKAAFAAYHEGRRHFRRNCLAPETDATTLTAWFDEHDCHSSELASCSEFKEQHTAFINKRVAHLRKMEAYQHAKIVEMPACSAQPNEAINSMVNSICQQLPLLHKKHGEFHPESHAGSPSGDNGRLSMGLLRIANIKQLVAIAKALLEKGAPDDLQIHLVVYHSRLPLLVRSNLESQLDTLFNRQKPKQVWENPLIKPLFAHSSSKEHMVLVLASPVCEVGRDWDLNFAICEPSSFRSFIQLSGRVNRHRRTPVSSENVILLNQNFRGLTQQKVAFNRPGFENYDIFNLASPKDLLSKTQPEQVEFVSAIPRIQQSACLDYRNNLIDLEHAHTNAVLFGFEETNDDNHFPYFASQWWNNKLTWCQQHQQKLRFRNSKKEQQFFFYLEDEDEDLVFCTRTESGELRNASSEVLQWLDDDKLTLGKGMQWLYQQDLKTELLNLADKLDIDIKRCSETYSQVSIDEDRNWSYQSSLGIYEEL